MKKIMVLLFCFVISSCAFIENIDLEDTKAKLAIQLSASKVVENGDSKARAAYIIKEIEPIYQFIDYDFYYIKDIKNNILKRIVDKNLKPSDMILINLVLDEMQKKIDEEIKSGALEEDIKVKTKEILDIVKEVCNWYL